jgi:hypothetical protein
MKGIEQAPSFLVDSPERLDEASDALGDRDYAQALAETLAEAQAPLPSASLGPWGREVVDYRRGTSSRS